MKLFVVPILFTSAAAVKCGTAISKDCLGDTDKRFDPTTGYDLADQNPIWARLTGLYKGPGANYAGIPPQIIGGEGGIPTYLNITVTGSRVYYHRYSLNPDGTLTLTDAYQTSTFEKDGSTKTLGLNSNFAIFGIGPFQISNKNLTAIALDGRSLYGSGQFPGDQDNFVQETYACLENDESAPCSAIATQLDYYLVIDGTPTYVQGTRFDARRIDEEEWIKELEAGIEASVMADEFDLKSDQCATKFCPSEEQWRVQDPYFRDSPYKEPKAL